MSIDKVMDKRTLRTTQAVAEAVNASVLVVSLAGSAVLTVATYADPAPLSVSVLAFLFASAAWSVHLQRRLRRHDATGYRILRLEGVMTVEPEGDHHAIDYVRTQEIQATQDDVRLIELREHWTGRGSADSVRVKCTRPADARFFDGRDPEEDGRVHRWIYPNRPLGRGERLTVELHQQHRDDAWRQRPYFRQGGGRHQAGHVIARVTFPSSYEPDAVDGAIWNTGRTLFPTQTVGRLDCTRTEDRMAGTVTFSVEANALKAHHSVGMRWIWPSQNNRRIGGTANAERALPATPLQGLRSTL
jgi:hypothetical protein